MEKIHAITKYDVEYGQTINGDLTDKVINVFKHAESGYVNEIEDFGEIYACELKEIIDKEQDEELKNALQTLMDETKEDEEYVRFSIF